MPNSIISNISAFNAQGNINIASNKASSSIARLSSGNRIVRASDDVAGLATGTALRTQVTTLRTALSNAAQGTSLLQVADGALGQIIDILQRQKAIATQASSGQMTDPNRALLNQEFTALTAEVDRISASTNFNGVSLLAGGLGQTSALVRTDALAVAAMVAAPSLGGATVTASTVSIQAFNTQTGVLRNAGAAGVVGNLIISDSAGTLLTNTQYLAVDGSVYGQFSNFSFSNVTYGATTAGSATMSATINGVTFTGNVTGNGANVTGTLGNGNTYIRLGLGAVDFTNGSTTEFTRAAIKRAFETTGIARVGMLSGVDFAGTRLAGITGSATTGVVTARLMTNGSVDISSFKYVSNGGAVDTNNLTVQVNGKTFTATNVDDQIAAGGNMVFSSDGEVEAIMINTTGLTTAITNIRTSLTDREGFINALNQGFARAGGGLNFAVGAAQTDSIRVQFGSSSTTTIYNGNTLSINTQANAQAASTVLDTAIQSVVSLRATVGSLQSRFNYASNAIQSSIENQDSARSVFLDTDVSAESTMYASAQVQLQAGIAVLAQANQLPQALLKLIG
jgi:flagellin